MSGRELFTSPESERAASIRDFQRNESVARPYPAMYRLFIEEIFLSTAAQMIRKRQPNREADRHVANIEIHRRFIVHE